MNTCKPSLLSYAVAIFGTAGLASSLVLPGLVSSQEPAAGDYTPTELVAAGKVFQESCTFCHVVPDPAHLTDRAWLNQVSDTA